MIGTAMIWATAWMRLGWLDFGRVKQSAAEMAAPNPIRTATCTGPTGPQTVRI